MSFLVNEDKKLNTTICDSKGRNTEDINDYLDGINSCTEDTTCNFEECSYCMGQANKAFESCLRQSFDECLVCKSTMVEGTCYKNINL